MAPHIELPRIPEPADEYAVMREQLEYLMAHAADAGQCGCSECLRYLRARSVLLEIFADRELPCGKPSHPSLPL
ncbi:MAG: hypothetical protein KGL39_33070 [Patescibacteria group bacterium]|nr:hypothetical protein [Patescibacteria group bacterium]